MNTHDPAALARRIQNLDNWALGYRHRPENAGKTYQQFWAEFDAFDPEVFQILKAHRDLEDQEPLKSATYGLWSGLDDDGWHPDTRGSNLPVQESFAYRFSGPVDRAWLDRQLDELDRRMPKIIEESEPEYVMEEFAGYAEVFRDAASPDDLAHVDARLDCILHKAGLVPGDEAEPCDDA